MCIDEMCRFFAYLIGTPFCKLHVGVLYSIALQYRVLFVLDVCTVSEKMYCGINRFLVGIRFPRACCHPNKQFSLY